MSATQAAGHIVGELGRAALGRASLVFDWLDRAFRAARSPGTGPYDGTGLHLARARALPVLEAAPDLLAVAYDSMAHSFWRAQELSLFLRHRDLLSRPLMDFGCGDGSFGRALFAAIDYGVENDPAALAVAVDQRVYGQLVLVTGDAIPLPPRSVSSVFANSVLEHVRDLESILGELARVLQPEGTFLFTVPTVEFTRQLARYFGRSEAQRINRESCHFNLMTAEQWSERLGRRGFAVRAIEEYQPDWFTWWYRMMRLVGPPGLGRLVPRLTERLWRRFRKQLAAMIRHSLATSPGGGGANILLHAQLRG